MLEAEVLAKVVQDILGHADVTLTLNTYSHVMGTTAHEQISKINDLFIKKPSEHESILNKIEDAKEKLKSNEETKNNDRNKKRLQNKDNEI